MSAGDAESIFELDGVIAASVICYDIRFPEWVRTQMAQGAKVLFCGSAVARTSSAAMGDFIKGACG